MNELKSMLAYTNIDVEALVNDYTKTLQKNNNREATERGTIVALKEWARQKDYLIRQVMQMPGYNGNLQAVMPITIPNERTVNDVDKTVYNNIWLNLFSSGSKILSKKNAEGKTLSDMILSEAEDMPEFVDVLSIASHSGKKAKSFSEFADNGITYESIKKRDEAQSLINVFRGIVSSRLDSIQAAEINAINKNIRAAEGMKTTRALGKVIKYYGLEDKTPGSVYGKEFIANYCELMKDGGRTLLFVISVNPIDYLKMSIGEFTSCHDIRGGGWRSGTISYMLDQTTMITYTILPGSSTEINRVTVSGKDRPELFSKIYRNVFHWDCNHRLIQSRVYPQGNEGATDLYKVLRHAVQSSISLANGWDPENWTNRKRKFIDFTTSGEGSTNYPDWSYEHFSGNLSTPGHATDAYSTEQFVIGAAPTCIVCGERHSSSRNLKCNWC